MIDHPSSPVRVLLLLERLITGGAERRFLRLARGLPPDRFAVRIGVLQPGGDLVDAFAATGLPIVPFYRRWRFDLSPVRRIAAYCRDERITVIHGMHWLSGTFAALVARGNPHVAALGSTVGHIYASNRLGPARALVDRRLSRYLAAMTVNSTSLREYLVAHGYSAAKIAVIPNGVALPDLAQAPALRAALRQHYAIPPDAPCVGILARLEPVKDHATFLRAAQIVAQTYPATRFVIAGAGSERDHLATLATDLGIAARVIFTGAVPGADAIIPAWDVAALSSRHEGLPNAVLEALAWGKPVVATNVGGVPAIITDGEHGYLAASGDASGLARGITALLADPARAQVMGAAGRALIAAHWSADLMVDRYANLYLNTLKQTS